MSSILFFKRVILNKVYWLSVMAAFLLVCCSILYTDTQTGEEFIVLSLFYNQRVKEYVQWGMISVKDVFIGYDRGYLWMFCPIIVGVPCVLNQRIERFILFRSSKNEYCFSKFISNLVLAGSILVFAYGMFFAVGMISGCGAFLGHMDFVKKIASVFCWGIINAIPSLLLAEFVKNKYLILCIPFVWNYFLQNFMGEMIPFEVWEYISPYNYQILFFQDSNKQGAGLALMLFYIAACAVFIRFFMERRCDCGQK